MSEVTGRGLPDPGAHFALQQAINRTVTSWPRVGGEYRQLQPAGQAECCCAQDSCSKKAVKIALWATTAICFGAGFALIMKASQATVNGDDTKKYQEEYIGCFAAGAISSISAMILQCCGASCCKRDYYELPR